MLMNQPFKRLRIHTDFIKNSHIKRPLAAIVECHGFALRSTNTIYQRQLNTTGSRRSPICGILDSCCVTDRRGWRLPTQKSGAPGEMRSAWSELRSYGMRYASLD